MTCGQVRGWMHSCCLADAKRHILWFWLSSGFLMGWWKYNPACKSINQGVGILKAICSIHSPRRVEAVLVRRLRENKQSNLSSLTDVFRGHPEQWRGVVKPVSWYLFRILETVPWEILYCCAIVAYRIPCHLKVMMPLQAAALVLCGMT